MGGAWFGAWNLRQLRCLLFSLLVLNPRRAMEKNVVTSFHVNPIQEERFYSEDKAYREVQLGNLTKDNLLTKPLSNINGTKLCKNG